MYFMETNRPFEKYTEVQLYVLQAVFSFYKMNMFLLCSLPNMIVASASHYVSGVRVGVVRVRFNKTQKKHVQGIDFACAL